MIARVFPEKTLDDFLKDFMGELLKQYIDDFPKGFFDKIQKEFVEGF